MKILDKLERRFGQLAIPHLTMLLVASQSFCYVLAQIKPELIRLMTLEPAMVAKGEVWRLISFMIIPPHTNFIFVFFALYVFYFMGTSLEEEWGIFRYNAYLFIAYIATIVAVFLGGVPIASNLFIDTSVFLAFAYLYPEIEFLLFLLVPVKVKYLAMFTWAFYGFCILTGSDTDRMLILASVCNFLLFFGRDIRDHYYYKRRRVQFEEKQQSLVDRALHECHVCGITEKSGPDVDFRVCSGCSDGQEYCMEHLRSHDHV